MPATKPATVTADRLKSFLERIEKLLEERAAIQSDIKDVFAEAKGVGYDVKTMRRLIQIRAQDSADRAEQEALLDTYMMALGMSNGPGAAREPTEDELEERASRIVSEVDRCMDLVEGGKPPKIVDIQELIGCSLGKASKLRNMVADRISRSQADDREMKSSGGVEGHAGYANPPSAALGCDAGEKTSAPSTKVGAGVEPGPLDTPQHVVTSLLAAPIAPLIGLGGGVIPPAPPADTRTFDDIVGPIPAHLRRAP